MPFSRAAATTDQSPDETRSVAARESLVLLSSQATSDLEESAPVQDAVADLRHERFQIGAKLGEGGMGVVYRAAMRATDATSLSSS